MLTAPVTAGGWRRVGAGGWRRVGAASSGAVLLALLVFGLPVALARLAGNPLPGDTPTLDGVVRALTSPDDGALFLAVLAGVGWLAWATFVASVLVEAAARFTRRRTPELPGLGGPQRLASALVAMVAAAAVSPVLSGADAAPVDGPPVATVVADPAPPPAAAAARSTTGDTAPAARETVHTVQRGEGFLDLQDRYGVPWHRIAEANHGAVQPDGGVLQRGQTRIYPGWQLRVPARAAPVAADTPAAAQPPTTVETATTVETSAAVGTSEPSDPVEYEVAKGDWMWHIAERYLGDPQRFPEIAALNPGYADRHSDFPDHIRPGWTLRLPAEATDRGPVPHATGEMSSPDRPEEQSPEDPQVGPEDWGGTAEPEGSAASPTPQAEGSPEPERSLEPAAPAPERSLAPAAPPTAAPDTPSATDDALAEVSEDAQDPDLLIPAAFGGAGLLVALALGLAARHRRQRHQQHTPGTVPPTAADRLQRTMRAARQPLDAELVDRALRALAATLSVHPRVPDLAGVLVTEGAVELLLGAPCPDPPAPWRERGDRWILPASVELPDATGTLAPLPALVTVGSQPGRHLLLDLERLGSVTLHGDPARATDLLRYLAAELACNTWSDAVEVLLVGFDPADASQLAEIGGERVRVLTSVSDGAPLLRQRAGAAGAALSHTGIPDTVTGRIQGTVADAWVPRILLCATPGDPEGAALALEPGQSRTATAVVTVGHGQAAAERWRIAVTDAGALHLRTPFLNTCLTAAALSSAELASMAETLRQARTGPPQPPPPAPEPPAWALGTDATGALLPAAAESIEHPVEPGSMDPAGPGSMDPAEPVTVAPPESDGAPAGYKDPDLDADLAAWYADDPGRPRLTVLGPVRVDGDGIPPTQRRRLHAELLVFLAAQGERGAGTADIDAALWPGSPVPDGTRQLLITRARTWLGTDAGGNPWLADIGADLAYRLAAGYLLDWHLFRRLRTRAENHGAAGTGDLRAALELVRGFPLEAADRPAAPGRRSPYPWLPDSPVDPDHLVAAVVDTAHQLAERCLAADDTAGVRWAVRQAWLADADRSYDQPWRDLMHAEYADGDHDQLHAVLAELLEVRDVETPEDLAPDTYQLIRRWSLTTTASNWVA